MKEYEITRNNIINYVSKINDNSVLNFIYRLIISIEKKYGNKIYESR